MLTWSPPVLGPPPEPVAAPEVAPKGTRGARWARNRELIFITVMVTLSALCFGVFLGLAANAIQLYGLPMLPFALLIGGLFYCALCYQVIRLGAARRARAILPAAVDPSLFSLDAPGVTVLVPSYRESRRVIIETVLSAALATYRNKRIVVLVDDPPGDLDARSETLGAVRDVRAWVEEARVIRDRTLARRPDAFDLAVAYDALAQWLDTVTTRLAREADPAFTHVDGFVADRIVRTLAGTWRADAARLRRCGADDLTMERNRLASLVAGDIDTFERKSFANLSHAPNKAMNLNGYLGLIGGAWRMDDTARGVCLVPAGEGTPDLVIPDTDYVLTLDADSVIRSDYILTLVGILEREPRAAVAQTPYLTFPGGPSPVERIAGATTDIQYLIHQGSSHYGAAYWVGANAIIRRSALAEIMSTRTENGSEVKVFVQDKTVIEDTGSTIDLLDRGWHVHNHFEPLAYSATPADFGALAIQRKRWANGGIILFFDLLRSHLRGRWLPRAFGQLVIRSHYLLSPLIGNTGILVLMLLAADHQHPLFWTPLFMAPYFILYMLDLRRMGYRWWDLFGVCSLNLMLLPVNLAGILASVWQMAGGPRHGFKRTPKVASRSDIPPYAFLFNVAILGLMAYYVYAGIRADKPLGIVIPLINILLYSYGLWRFVGFRGAVSDVLVRADQIAAGLRDRLLPRSLGPRGRAVLLSVLTFIAALSYPLNTQEVSAQVPLPIPDIPQSEESR